MTNRQSRPHRAGTAGFRQRLHAVGGSSHARGKNAQGMDEALQPDAGKASAETDGRPDTPGTCTVEQKKSADLIRSSRRPDGTNVRQPLAGQPFLVTEASTVPFMRPASRERHSFHADAAQRLSGISQERSGTGRHTAPFGKRRPHAAPACFAGLFPSEKTGGGRRRRG